MEVLQREAGTASDGLVTFEESAIPASTDADETEPWTPAATSKEVVFTIEADHAAQVQVMGDFNDWNLEGSEMERVDGIWQKVVTLPPGRYRYSYIVDGRWQSYTLNVAVAPNHHGGFDSILEEVVETVAGETVQRAPPLWVGHCLD